MSIKERPGLSLVICTHNGASRLPKTLEHLVAQRVTTPYEVIVVDNASTDNTGEIAQRFWVKAGATRVPLRVVTELEMGLSYARRRGLSEASYGLIALVDDDNWLAPDWVARASQIMVDHPGVGGCGGWNEPACETPAPAWFNGFQFAYACGPQGGRAGEVAESRGYLYGAGFVLRKAAWEQLQSAGFRQLLSCRSGNKLTSGGDTEMCMALRLAGWGLWYEPDLRLQHYMPVQRLNWDYLLRMYRGFGESMPMIRAYEHCLGSGDRPATGSWWRDALRECVWIAHRRRWLAKRMLGRSTEGHFDALRLELHQGILCELCRLRSRYEEGFRTVMRLRERLQTQRTQ